MVSTLCNACTDENFCDPIHTYHCTVYMQTLELLKRETLTFHKAQYSQFIGSARPHPLRPMMCDIAQSKLNL